MEEKNLTPDQSFALNTVEDLHQKGDFGMIKNDVVKMFTIAMSSEELDDQEVRTSFLITFKHLYNFLLLMEMTKDKDVVKTANLFEC